MIIVFYLSISLPFNLAFFIINETDGSTLETCIDIVFICDLLLQFNVAIPHPNGRPGQVLAKRQDIAMEYLRGWFAIDLLAVIPFDQLFVLFQSSDATSSGKQEDGGEQNLQALGLLKGLRLPRLLRLVKLLRVVKLLRINPEVNRWLKYSRHANLLRLLGLVMQFLATTHILACLWHGIVVGDEWKAMFFGSIVVDSQAQQMHNYWVSFYTSLLLIMGENIEPKSDPELVFSSFVLLIGAVLMAVVFGNVAVLIANFTASQSAYQKKMEMLYENMRRMALPTDLQSRIHIYYQNMWERHGTLNGIVTQFIPELSNNLRSEVLLYLRMDMITNVPFFQQCSPEVVHELVLKLNLEVYMAKDYVVVRGEIGNHMYFIQKGRCEVTAEVAMGNARRRSQVALKDVGQTVLAKERRLAVLTTGKYFGEIALLMNCKRTANVRAVTFCELCTLSRPVFEEIAAKYTTDRDTMEKLILEKYDQMAMNIFAETVGGRRGSTESVSLDEQVELNQLKIIQLLEKLGRQLEDDHDVEDDDDSAGKRRRSKRSSIGFQRIKSSFMSMSDIREEMRQDEKQAQRTTIETPEARAEKDQVMERCLSSFPELEKNATDVPRRSSSTDEPKEGPNMDRERRESIDMPLFPDLENSTPPELEKQPSAAVLSALAHQKSYEKDIVGNEEEEYEEESDEEF